MINIDDKLLDILNEDQVFLCLQIARYMRSNSMIAWPSLSTLSNKCKWDERKVKAVRNSLVDCGFIEAKIVSGKPTEYRFLQSGISLFYSKKSKTASNESEIEEFKGGTENEGGVNAGGTENEGAFSAKEGGHFLPPEFINKELINYISSFLGDQAENQKTDFPEWRKIEAASVKKVTNDFWKINPYTKERIFEIETPTEFLNAMENALNDQLFFDRICRETGIRQQALVYSNFTSFFEDWASQEKLIPYKTSRQFRQHLFNYCAAKTKRENSTSSRLQNGQFRQSSTQTKGSKIMNMPNDLSRYSQPQNF